MGHRHRRRAHRGLAINLGMMPLVDLGIVAAQPDTTDREAAITLALGNAGFPKQWQRPAARANKDELCLHRSLVTAIEIMNFDPPASICLPDEAGYAVLVGDLAARLADEMTDQMMGE